MVSYIESWVWRPQTLHVIYKVWIIELPFWEDFTWLSLVTNYLDKKKDINFALTTKDYNQQTRNIINIGWSFLDLTVILMLKVIFVVEYLFSPSFSACIFKVI